MIAAALWLDQSFATPCDAVRMRSPHEDEASSVCHADAKEAKSSSTAAPGLAVRCSDRTHLPRVFKRAASGVAVEAAPGITESCST